MGCIVRTAHCCVVGSCLGSGYRAGAVPGFGVVLHCGRAGLGVHVLPGAWRWCTGVVVVIDFCVGFLIGRVSNIESLNFLVPRNVAIRRSNLMIGVAVYRYPIWMIEELWINLSNSFDNSSISLVVKKNCAKTWKSLQKFWPKFYVHATNNEKSRPETCTWIF